MSISNSKVKIEGTWVDLSTLVHLTAPKKASYLSNAFFQSVLLRSFFFLEKGVWIDNSKIEASIVQLSIETKVEKQKKAQSGSKQRAKTTNGGAEITSGKNQVVPSMSLNENFSYRQIIEKLEIVPINDFEFSKTLKWSLPLGIFDVAMMHMIDHYLMSSDVAFDALYNNSRRFHQILNQANVVGITQVVKQQLGTLNDFISSCFFSNDAIQSATINPVIEEIEFSLILQELGLRQLPKMIIKKIAPGNEHLVDHMAIKVLRVVVRSALFALLHYNPNSTVALYGVMNSFRSSMLIGTLQEVNHLTLLSIAAHIIINSSLILTYNTSKRS